MIQHKKKKIGDEYSALSGVRFVLKDFHLLLDFLKIRLASTIKGIPAVFAFLKNSS